MPPPLEELQKGCSEGGCLAAGAQSPAGAVGRAGTAPSPVPMGGIAPWIWFVCSSPQLALQSFWLGHLHFSTTPLVLQGSGVLVVLFTPPELSQSYASMIFCWASSEGVISSAGLDPSCHLVWCKSVKASAERKRFRCLPATKPLVWREGLLLPALQAARCLGGFMLCIESYLFCAPLR